MDGDFLELIPTCLCNPEVQSAILIGLTCVGAWVIISWFLQIIFTCLWPFFLVVGVLIFMPSLRKALVRDLLPKYTEAFRTYGQRFLNLNSTNN